MAAVVSAVGRTRSPRAQERGGARDHAFALSDARLDFHPGAVDDARLHLPNLDLAVAHDIEARLVAVPLQCGRRNANPVATGELDLARSEGADMGARNVLERDPDFAGAARFVDLLVDEADAARDRPFDARQLQLRRHADREAGERLLGHVGLEIDRSVLNDAEQRLARSRGGGAELGGPAADDSRDGRLHFRPADAHLKFLPLRVAALAVGLGDAERVLGRG